SEGKIFARIGIVYEFAAISFVISEVLKTDNGESHIVGTAKSRLGQEIPQRFTAAPADDAAFHPAARILFKIIDLLRIERVVNVMVNHNLNFLSCAAGSVFGKNSDSSAVIPLADISSLLFK